MIPDDEIWAQLRGFPDYTISNYGEVYNLKHKRSLTKHRDQNGQHRVFLYNHKGKKGYVVCVLVAKLFMPGYLAGALLRHVDGNPENNYIGNLRMRSEFPGKRALLSRVGDKGRRVQIVETGEVFRNVTACAQAIYGDPSHIYRVLNGQSKTHRGFTFIYVEE